MSVQTTEPPAKVLDPERLRVLEETDLLDGPSVEVFDRLTGLAARVTGAPVALVSLVDSDRQFFVSAVGLSSPWRERRQTPLSHSFCQYVVDSDAPLVISDARADDLLCTNLAVPDLRVIAYAGFPLRAPDGHTLGSFCVVDTKPREWTQSDLATIDDLAAAAESKIAVLLTNARLERTTRDLEHDRVFLGALLDSLDEAVVACDATGRLVLRNRAQREQTDLLSDDMTIDTWAEDFDLYAADGVTPLAAIDVPIARAFRGETVRDADMVVRPSRRPRRHFRSNAQPIRTPDGTMLGAVAAVHDVTAAVRMARLREVHHVVATGMSDARTSADAAVHTVSTVAGAMGWMHGEYWQVSSEDAVLRPVATWTDPALESSGVASGAEELADSVRAFGKAVWTPAGDASAATGLGLPVRAGDRVFGVLVFLHEDPLGVDPDVLLRLEGIGAHLGRFVERRLADASRRAFERVVSGIDDHVWTIEVLPDATVEVVYGSPNGVAVFGTELTDHVDPRDAAAFADFHREVVEGAPSHIEARFTCADGETRWIWIRAVPRREDGHLFVDGICTDVTERHRISEQLAALLDAARPEPPA